jgi:hypothetical protein
MTIEQRLEYWREHFKRQEESGLDQKTYCIQNGLSPDLFYHYKHRLRKFENNDVLIPNINVASTSLSSFIKVERSVGTDSRVTLNLGDSMVFEFDQYPNPSRVADHSK